MGVRLSSTVNGATAYVAGKVYDDRRQIFMDGEEGTVGPIRSWVESPNFYLITTMREVYKLEKDEEIIDGRTNKPTPPP